MPEFSITPELRMYLEILKSQDFERNVAYMYVDSQNQITVGVGHNITAHRDLDQLTFIVRVDDSDPIKLGHGRVTREHVRGGNRGKPVENYEQRKGKLATAAEKQNDYDFLLAHAGGLPGEGLSQYLPDPPVKMKKYTTLDMPPDDVQTLFESDLNDSIDIVRSEFGQNSFDKFPPSCQAALIDMAFNMGLGRRPDPNRKGDHGRGLRSFTTMYAAINGEGNWAKKTWAERWRAAAAGSRRIKISEARNNKISEWFLRGSHR